MLNSRRPVTRLESANPRKFRAPSLHQVPRQPGRELTFTDPSSGSIRAETAAPPPAQNETPHVFEKSASKPINPAKPVTSTAGATHRSRAGTGGWWLIAKSSPIPLSDNRNCRQQPMRSSSGSLLGLILGDLASFQKCSSTVGRVRGLILILNGVSITYSFQNLPYGGSRELRIYRLLAGMQSKTFPRHQSSCDEGCVDVVIG